MVKHLLMLLLLFIFPIIADDVTFKVDIDPAYAQQPIKGMITITHNPSAKIDLNTFKLDGKPINVIFIKDVPFTSKLPTVLSIFDVELPPQSEGLYSLPSISARIGNQTYHSSISTYSVGSSKETSTKSNVAKKAKSKEPKTSTSILRLESSVDGPVTLYPGQHTRLVYRYYYTGHIELITERLPLLDATGFIKIGEKEFKDYSEKNVSISEISQIVEATKPGEFSFPSSLIEGYAYLKDSSGEQMRMSNKLVSEAAGITIVVLPFPAKDQPASFNGAVGDEYQFKVSLLSSPTINMGDTITLGIDITGPGEINQVPPPDVCCQPGFTGFFSTNNLPPTEKVTDNTKTITVQLRPLTPGIKEIPSLEFSYFNPSTVTYSVLHSVPIPIKIIPPKPAMTKQIFDNKMVHSLPPQQPSQQTSAQSSQQTPSQPSQQLPSQGSQQSLSQTISPPYHPSPIEIKGVMPLQSIDLYNKLFGTWWTLIIFPLGIALCLYQMQVRQYLVRQRSLPPIQTSDALLRNALKQKPGSSQYFKLLSDAMKMALVEKGMISSVDTNIEDLPHSGIANDIRMFLINLDEQHFVESNQTDFTKISSQAQSFIDQLHANKQTGGES